MKISPVANNKCNYRGRLNSNTGDFILFMEEQFIRYPDKSLSTLDNFSLSMRMAMVYKNLNTIMKQFAHRAELSISKMKDYNIYKFFIEHPHSYYKHPVSTISLSKNLNTADDVDKIESTVKILSETEPFKINSKFKIQQKPGQFFSFTFEPDERFDDLKKKLAFADKKELENITSPFDMISYFKELNSIK